MVSAKGAINVIYKNDSQFIGLHTQFTTVPGLEPFLSDIVIISVKGENSENFITWLWGTNTKVTSIEIFN